MTPEETLARAIEAFNRHDADEFANLHAPNVRAYDPQYPEPLQGRAAIREDIAAFFAAFPDIRAEVESVLSRGDTIAAEVTIRGTHEGPLITPGGEVPATHRRFEMPGARFERVDGSGLITQCNRYYDLAGLMMQLGLMGDGAE